MHVSVVSIPPPLGEGKRCIMPTRQGQRCMSKVNDSDFDEFKEQLSKLQNSTGTEQRLILENMICLRACKGTHRKPLRTNTEQLSSLVSKFERCPYKSAEVDIFLNGYKRVEFSDHKKSKKSIMIALRDSPLKVPCVSGFVYAFTTPYKPGYVKIGWAKDPTKRVTTWGKCFPDISLLLKEKFDFPEQMELLIHIANVKTRVEIECGCCSKSLRHLVKHDEWFRMTETKVQQEITGWKDLTVRYPLYTKDRILSERWKHALPFIEEQTVSGLSQAMEQSLSTVSTEAEIDRLNESFAQASFFKDAKDINDMQLS